MASIGVNLEDNKVEHIRSVSRNSSLNLVQSSYTLSALRSSFMGSQDSLSFSRFGSMSSLSDYPAESLEDDDFDNDQIAEIIDDLTNKFFKNAYKIKDKDFASNLLELEKALVIISFCKYIVLIQHIY
jgi:hypothetical protein